MRIIDITANLLEAASELYKDVGSEVAPIAEDMLERCEVYETVARQLRIDPGISIGADSITAIAGELLTQAARFMRQMAEQNPLTAEDLLEGAKLYEKTYRLLLSETQSAPTQLH